ncbi:eukaryotic translation initiation factor 1 [Manacus vitellinus]|uniref:eukaryotic translation initiation factor 1 n=1 Tax=Manacus vitellinus TaxID=328815 RepID=UPI00115C67A4|nr:eukaryotic translation initiation factor 1 [Manacus vitellinus]
MACGSRAGLLPECFPLGMPPAGPPRAPGPEMLLYTGSSEGAEPDGAFGSGPADPFADASKGDDLLPAGTEDYIHIRIQQRNGRKTLTTVQGIADDYDKKKLVKAFKKKFACNGTVIEHPEYGEVIQLQGDQRKNICQFLVEIGLAKDDQLKVHGF